MFQKKIFPVLLTFALLFISGWETMAGYSVTRFESMAQAAREKKGRSIIVVSPKGSVKGTLKLDDAVAKLMPGMTLKILPGHYYRRAPLIIKTNNVIIESDGSGKYCQLRLCLWGKDIVLRNMFCWYIDIGDGVAIDSKTYHFRVSNGGQRIKSLIYNCCFPRVTVYPNRSEITFMNCSIVDAYKREEEQKVYQEWRYTARSTRSMNYTIVSFGQVNSNSEVVFINSLLFSNAFVFGGHSREIDLILDNCVIFGASYIRLGKDNEIVTKLKYLDKYFDFKEKKVITSRPIFVKEPITRHSWRADMREYMLSKDSLGYKEGIGVKTGSNSSMPGPQK